MKKQILFIGDMNGNSQALARRFVELKYKCEIIPFYEDYCGSPHFKYNKLNANIVVHDDVIIYNGYPTLAYNHLYGFLFRLIINFYYAIKNKPIQVSKRRLRKLLLRKNFIIIGTGISPILLKDFGKPLDIYYPSSQGVEFIGSPEGFENSKGSFLKLILYKFIKSRMLVGIKKTVLVVNSDVGLTHDTLKEIDLKNYYLDLIPFVEPYHEKYKSNVNTSGPTKLVMYSRLHWVRPDSYEHTNWMLENKNNDLFITAFASFIEENNAGKDVELTIIEYGKDVSETHALVNKLGIQESVRFHPIVPKQEILSFLNRYDILVGEFLSHNVSIGGTGLEALQMQKPFINGGWLSCENDRRLKSQPPVYFCNTQLEITTLLKILIINKVDPLKKDREFFFNHIKSNDILKYWIKSLPDA